MNVVYSSSDSFTMVAGISIYSLLCNNKDADELNIFLIDNGITKENKEMFTRMCDDFNRSISFIPIADIEKLAGTSIDIGRWNISTFARLFYASLLPQWVEKVIHIDCDTMIMTSLKPLWDIDMGDKVVAGSLECIADSYKTEIGLKKDDIYINAGNIMLNLKRIREKNLEEDFKKFIFEHKQLSFVDQPVLNGCLTNDEKLIVELNYNAYSINFYLKYKHLKKAKRVSNFYNEQEVKNAIENPYIVHFTSCFMDGTRPWIEGNLHPLLPQYLEFKKNSPWGEFPLWKDDRGAIKKLASKMFRFLPQGFVAWSIGFVHAVVVPTIHKIKG